MFLNTISNKAREKYEYVSSMSHKSFHLIAGSYSYISSVEKTLPYVKVTSATLLISSLKGSGLNLTQINPFNINMK